MDKKRVKIAYVPPRTEVYVADPYALLAGTFFGGSAGGAVFGEYFGGSAGSASFGNSGGSGGSAGSASFENGFSGGGGGSAGQAHFDAKAVILGQEFGFSDPWE